jgi:phosphatidylinositol alpha-1,6-mannosyltransferase
MRDSRGLEPGDTETTARRRDLVLVTAGLGLDGGGRALVGRLLARAAAEYAGERGIGFRILELSGGAGPEVSATPPGIEVRRFSGRRGALARTVWATQLRRPAPALLFDLLGMARAQVLLPRSFRAPYLVWVHGIEVWRPLGGLRRRALARADRVLASSAQTLERAEPFLPALSSPPAPLHLALESRPLVGEADAGVLERAGHGFVLTVGRMSASERYKGHDELIESWPRVLEREPGARLVVAGGGDDRPRLEAKAHSAGLADWILFTGFVSEATLGGLYERAALFALPSRGEGFGLVFLEAMRAGLPCVALAGTAAQEVVEAGRTGLLVDSDATRNLVGGLAAAVASLLGAPERARALGEAGRERWRRAFGYDRFLAALTPHLDALTAP